MTHSEYLLQVIGEVNDEAVWDARFGGASHRSTLRKFVTAALVAVLMLSMSVTAVGYYTGAEWFERFFSRGTRLNDRQADYITQAIVDIDQTVVAEGWSVTLDKGMTDGSNVFLTLIVTPPEGAEWTEDFYGFDRFYLQKPDSLVKPSGSARLEWTEETAPNNGRVVALSFWYDPNQMGEILTQGGQWRLYLENLRRDDKESLQTTETVEGTWSFSFSFPESYGGVELLDGPTMTASGTVELISVRISALGLWIEYHAESEEAEKGVILRSGNLSDYADSDVDYKKPCVVMTDGTEYSVSGYGGSATIGASGVRRKLNYTFRTPILLENADYLLFNDGTKIPIQ